MIDNRHFLALELEKILTELSLMAGCEDSAKMALNTTPITDLFEAKKQMTFTSDAHTMASRFGAPSVRGLKNVVPALERAEMGATLSFSEFIEIGRFLKILREMKAFRDNWGGEKETSLDPFFDSLMPNRALEERIDYTFVSEEEISDTASPELADIRRKIRNSQQKVRDKLDNIIHSATYSKYLQDAIVTIRDGRFCVPVKAEYRNEIKGLVHDTSGSGATVFIEPAGVVDENNEVRVLRAQEKQEIAKILFELSGEVGAYAKPFSEDYHSLVLLDYYFAKARLGDKMRGAVPELTEDGIVILSKARHPLIPAEKIVPVDISIGKDFDVLVITGPNTGGKTVALKTLGLLTLMAMCALMIPAGETSKVSVFKNVFADIGDEQSIEQSLSTFSSHINNTIDILKKADEHSLVLLDELGAGTDPVEGAALAVAVIERLKLYGAKLLATTHYAEIKMYALETERVENACCEFDVASLSPTYKLLIGVPGKSNAFAISERLGMDSTLVDRARELVTGENAHFEEVVSKLEESRQELEKEQRRAEEYRIEAQRVRNDVTAQKELLDREREKELEKARATAHRMVEQVREESRKIIEELSSLKKDMDSDNATDIITRARAMMKAGVGKIEDIADPLSTNKVGDNYTLPRKLKRGDTVKIAGLSKEGTVLSEPDGAGYLTVQTGLIKTRVNIKELRLIENKGKVTRNGGSVTKSVKSNATRRAATELDLRGQDSLEAVLNLERFIDECLLMNIKEISIIHGKGTGALRSAVHNALKSNKAIKSYRLGAYGEGESGVTIALFK